MKEQDKNATKPMTLPIANLREAEWNTHRPSKSDDAAYQGLIESLKANGMLHRVAVRPLTNQNYEIIDGHRRVEAATAIGWKEVPCEVHAEMTDEEAQAMTLTANVQRIDNDPLLEAECIERLADAGKSYGQIAAELGKDERYVARRARIINLSDKWRTLLKDAETTADELEMIASYEKSLQDEVYDDLEIDPDDFELDMDDVERVFRNNMRKIDGETPFDTDECANCPCNTATHGLLFPVEEDCSGRCQKPECFKAKWNAAVDEQIAALRKRKIEVKEAKSRYDIPNYWNSKPKRDKQHTKPWIYTESELKHLVWAEPKAAPITTAPAMTEEEKAEQRRIKKAHNAWTKNRKSACEKIREMLKADGKPTEIVEALMETDAYRKYLHEKAIDSFTGWTSDWVLENAFKCLGSDALAALGCDGFTTDEVDAMQSGDPAEDPADANLAEADDFNGEEA